MQSCGGDLLIFDQIVSLLFQFGMIMGLGLGKWYVRESKVHCLWTWLRKRPTDSSTFCSIVCWWLAWMRWKVLRSSGMAEPQDGRTMCPWVTAKPETLVLDCSMGEKYILFFSGTKIVGLFVKAANLANTAYLFIQLPPSLPTSQSYYEDKYEMHVKVL